MTRVKNSRDLFQSNFSRAFFTGVILQLLILQVLFYKHLITGSFLKTPFLQIIECKDR